MTRKTSTLLRLGPMLAAVVAFEEIACDITRRQSTLAPIPGLARALAAQSRQEAMHAAAFGVAVRWTGGRAAAPPRMAAGLRRLRRSLDADLDRGDLAASMLGLHCVFEGLGGVALQPPGGDLGRLADRLVPLRSLVVLQEHAHEQLGERWVARLARDAGALRRSCDGYFEIAEEVVDAGLALFDGYPADHALYLDGSRRHLAQVRAAFA
jgi:hypothetical protein